MPTVRYFVNVAYYHLLRWSLSSRRFIRKDWYVQHSLSSCMLKLVFFYSFDSWRITWLDIKFLVYTFLSLCFLKNSCSFVNLLYMLTLKSQMLVSFVSCSKLFDFPAGTEDFFFPHLFLKCNSFIRTSVRVIVLG